ncbi:MAG: nucleoside triphosphate pyrophosphatase [Lysobacterales bacterium]
MNTESLSAGLILASSSKYRTMLLERLGIPFECLSPDIDETRQDAESPLDLVSRLAMEKARSVSWMKPRSVVIGSDQIAVFDGRIIGKPGDAKKATAQLMSFSGQAVEFLTAVSVQCLDSNFAALHVDTTGVGFRNLHADEIKRYLEIEKPFDCAGAFKAESLGITLFDYIRSEDPTALIGLPLIRTASMLRHSGLRLP